MMNSVAWRNGAIAALAGAAAIAAGAAAFAAGAWQRSATRTRDATDDVVAPGFRTVMALTSVPANGAKRPRTALLSRLDPEVVFNPFGVLAPMAAASLGQPKAPPLPLKTKPKLKTVEALASPPPPAPTAPPAPFTAIGSLSGADVTGGQPVAFLQQQGQLLVVRAGEPIGHDYRVESITPQRVELTYLPLMQRQSLPLAP